MNPLAILVMAFFGVITTPLWPTYLPAIALTPLAMGKIAACQGFRKMPPALILGISVVIGVVGGVAVISIIVPWHDSPELVGDWLSAGAASGAVTLAIISLIYRWTPAITERHSRTAVRPSNPGGIRNHVQATESDSPNGGTVNRQRRN